MSTWSRSTPRHEPHSSSLSVSLSSSRTATAAVRRSTLYSYSGMLHPCWACNPPHGDYAPPDQNHVIPQFATLGDAVRATFPPDACRVLAMTEHGDAGYALFDTRPTGEPYLYEVHYQRQGGLWLEGSSSNGSGWHRFDLDTDRGIETVWGEAPPGADRARFELDRKSVV